jgi:S1-C subfamily serine protease
LAQHRERLGLICPNFDRLNEFVRHVTPAIGWVKIRQHGTGSGFLIAPNLVATNRHVIFDGQQQVSLDRVLVHIAGAHRSVVGARLPANPALDIALLELAEAPNIPELRVGYTSLTEVGERVLAIGFPVPEGESFDENLLVDHGIVNRMRTQPESGERQLELGLRIFSGMSGGPVFNDLGEVIGISSFVRYMSATRAPGTVVDKSSHAIAVEALYELL